jgi:hypothetical protein
MVVCAVERGGEICCKVPPNASRQILHRFAEEHSGEAEAVYTDGLRACRGIQMQQAIDKSCEGRMSGSVHTQTNEAAGAGSSDRSLAHTTT